MCYYLLRAHHTAASFDRAPLLASAQNGAPMTSSKGRKAGHKAKKSPSSVENSSVVAVNRGANLATNKRQGQTKVCICGRQIQRGPLDTDRYIR